jgi:hypothetical protein
VYHILGHVVLYAVMMAATPQQPNMPNNTKSETEYVSQIHALSSEANDLTDSIGRWNKWNTLFVGLTVVAAFGLFVTQRTVNGKTDRLVAVEGQLGDVKDNLASFKLELLRGENLKLEGDLNTQSGTVAGLQKDASDAKAAQQRVEIELGNQKNIAAGLGLKAEQLKRDNLTLEQELSPRLFIGQKDAAKRLMQFSGTPVILEYSTFDLECKRSAEQVAYVLNEAGWKITPRPNNDPNPVFFEGIVVGYVSNSGGIVPTPSPPITFPFEQPSAVRKDAAGTVLLDELNKTGLDAHTVAGAPMNASPTVYIYVGFKPSPHNKRLLKLGNEMEKRIRASATTGKPPDLTDLFEQMRKEQGQGDSGGRLPLPSQ